MTTSLAIPLFVCLDCKERSTGTKPERAPNELIWLSECFGFRRNQPALGRNNEPFSVGSVYLACHGKAGKIAGKALDTIGELSADGLARGCETGGGEVQLSLKILRFT